MKENVSEKYRKYLLKIAYDNQYYYTVAGADLQDEEKDKLLINSNKQLVLFSDVASLLQAIKKGEYYFDRDNLQKWEKEFSSSEEPYAEVDLDIVGRTEIDFTDSDELISIHLTLGILTDYAIQIDDKLMIARLYESVIEEFKDSVMDYAIWKITEDLIITFDRNLFLSTLNDLYFSLKKGMILVVH
ncbi:hypothetical protein A4H97_11140 [Niastella yeongjuensis]|uniref:Uncharacterized protein n=1 Tax=Niastella yeongjuensis TaxID=354355 RepID=A0A1V9E9D4_9BACT|nr:hypothetical protein [Niastella yeongjuensis]OQP42716.1 hypothetical protein A4H97_11140 [Niastella yeongjuensis]SEO51056.1 hypothetical protein SAMN05660816_02895 [Niastella yeongjuensis]